MFKRWAVTGLIPAVVLGSLAAVGSMGHEARAESPEVAPPQDPHGTPYLPPGVHRQSNGRYVKDMCDHTKRRHCMGEWLLPEDWKPGMMVPARPYASPDATGGMGPADVLAAYSIPAASTGAGRIVAIVDAPDSHALADLNTYRSHYSLPAMVKCTGMPSGSGTPCFAQINEDGTPSTNTDPNPDDDGETSLDMDMISAACPDCSILLVEISPNFCETDFTAATATATALGASAISISIGGPESTDPTLENFDAGPQTGPDPCPGEDTWVYDTPGPYSSPGHLVFVASGDFAYDNGNLGLTATQGFASPSYPSSSPYVIAVGGTDLYAKTGGGYGEGVWDDGNFGLFQGTSATGKYQDITTSGCSTIFAMPPWQSSVLTGSGCTMRATADISAAANFYRGTTSAGIELCESGGCGGAEGTSAASPLVAAIFTRLNLTNAASSDLAFMYNNPTAFNDVGSSGYALPTGGKLVDAPASSTCVTGHNKLCTAGEGWDGPTGLGSPNGAALALLPITATPVPYPDAGVPIELAGDGGAAGDDSGSTGDDDSGSTTGDDDDSGSSTGDDSGTILTGDDSGIITPSPDASTTLDGSAAGDGGGGGSSSSSGCSCTAAGSSPVSGGFALLGAAIGLAGFGARRRRNRGE